MVPAYLPGLEDQHLRLSDFAYHKDPLDPTFKVRAGSEPGKVRQPSDVKISLRNAGIAKQFKTTVFADGARPRTRRG